MFFFVFAVAAAATDGFGCVACFSVLSVRFFHHTQFHLCLCMHFMNACDQRLLYFFFFVNKMRCFRPFIHFKHAYHASVDFISTGPSLFFFSLFFCCFRLFYPEFLFHFHVFIYLYRVLKWPPHRNLIASFISFFLPKVWNLVSSALISHDQQEETRSFLRPQMTHFKP